MKKTILKKGKMKNLLVLLLACVFSLSMVFAFACDDGSTDEDEYDPSFSHTDYTDETELHVKNGDFSIGLVEKKNEDYPINSANSWNVSSDTNANSSQVTNGIISTSDDAWKAVLTKFYDTDVFKKWAENKYNIVSGTEKDAFITQLTGANGFLNPGTPTGANDDKVMMLANLASSTSVEGVGTAMKAASTSIIELAKGSSATISVWVKTVNVTANGANIQVVSTINDVQQATYAVKGIVTDGEWQKITIYVKGNEYAKTSIAVTLGLGLGNTPKTIDDYTEGFAFFDGVVAEVEEDYSLYANATNETFGSLSSSGFNGKQDKYRVDYDANVSNYFLNLTLADKATVFNSTTPDFSGITFYEFNNNADEVNSTVATANGETTITLKKAAAKVTFLSDSINAGDYIMLNFKVQNKLSAYSFGGVKFYIKDINGASVINPSTALLTNDKASDDFVEYTVLIKNNFETGSRDFELIMTIGTEQPLENLTNSVYYPNGTVTLKDFRVRSGNIENDEVPAYLFLASLCEADENCVSYALYAGNNADFTEPDDTKTYALEISEVNKHNIKTEIVNAIGYTGVTANHAYVTPNGEYDAVNSLETAGVINTEFASAYTNLPNLEDAIGTYDEAIQPLVIYNATAGNYGFIGTTKNVLASSNLQVNVKVKVVGDAVAYIYLVDMTKSNKLSVISQEFKGNYGTQKEDYKNDLVVKVTADTCAKYADENGWATVSILLGAGADKYDYRVELWNGSRDGQETSQGYVFFDEIEHTSFTENENLFANKINDDNALYKAYTTTVNNTQILTDADIANGIVYKQELTKTEKEYNAEKDEDISYPAKYVYVSNAQADGSATFIYAVMNSINPVEVDPYADETTEEETETESGCTATFDSATFWLQFSSIALVVVLILAMIALIVKILRRKHKAKVKVRSRYSVTSRNKTYNAQKEKQQAKAKSLDDILNENTEDSINNESEEETATEEETEYSYGEVLEDFSDEVEIDGKVVELPSEENEKTDGNDGE
ncbi:MAG: hypothetical protein J6V68_03340 [Clostridia bacterium]|nr:hypothetical protein [Clostridia bacterium]